MNADEMKFFTEVANNIAKIGEDKELKKLSLEWLIQVQKYKYAHNFSWMGRPVIQCPQDLMAMQEIIWRTKPDLIIETGIAFGGSLVFYASMLELIGKGEALGIDIEIRPHNKKKIEDHPMYKRIRMIEGSSVDSDIVQQVYEIAQDKENVLVAFDSNHTHDHVLAELMAYSPLVKKGNYIVVFDTGIEDLPAEIIPNRPWGKGNNPKTAVWEFLKTNDNFEIDKDIENKILLTTAPDGFLKRVL